MRKQPHPEQVGEHCAGSKLTVTVNNGLLHCVPFLQFLVKCAIGYSAEKEIKRGINAWMNG